MKRRSLSLALVGLFGLLAATANAQVTAAPSLMNFQGRLTKPDSTPVANGTYSLRFSLWDAASGGTEKWNQTINSVTVNNGTFAVLLNTNTAGLFNSNLWLEIKIGTNAPLTPRQQLVSVAYAMKANSVPDGSITGASIANGSITGDKLANNALDNLTWKLNGNSGTNPSSHFLGTNDNSPLVFRTNSAERMRLDGSGNFGIGTSTPDFPLSFPSTLGDKISLWGQSGVHYGFGIQSGLLQIHSAIASDDIAFGYGTSAAFTERMRIKGSGGVGIGTSSPGARLDVRGGGGVHIFAGDRTPFGNAAIETDFTAPATHAWFAENGERVFSVTGGGEGYFAGIVTAGGAITAPSATIPILNGNVNVGGEVKAQIVTVLGGSDVAEPYNVSPAGEIKAVPGYVVAIDPDKVGQMRVVSRAYDTTVAGIISGANGVNPGITLRQKGTVADGELPVASIGRVWCWCDADAGGPIVGGDLLTTSDTPGHAMKAVDKERRDGAIIGKAMSSLKSGKGLVLVLVSLK